MQKNAFAFSGNNIYSGSVYGGAGSCPTDAFRKQPVPAAYCEVFNRTLRTVIVNAQMSILQITAQIGLLIQRI